MNTNRRHAWTSAFLLLASASPVLANDMTMVLPIFAAPFLLAGLLLAIALSIVARVTRVRTGILVAILMVGTLLSGIPGAICAAISIGYVSSRYADIAISYLIAFGVYVTVVLLAFWAIGRRNDGRTAADITDEAMRK